MKKNHLIFSAVVVGLAAILTSGNASADKFFVTDNGTHPIDTYSSDGGPRGWAFDNTFATGLNNFQGLKFDSNGKSYVVNDGSRGGSVEEFDPIDTTHKIFTTKVSDNSKDPAFDHWGNFDGTHDSNWSVTAYDPTSFDKRLFGDDLSYTCSDTTSPNGGGGNIVNVAPEPSTYALLCAGLGLLLFLNRRKSAKI